MAGRLALAAILLATGYLSSFTFALFLPRQVGETLLLLFLVASLLAAYKEWKEAPLLVILGSLVGFFSEFLGLSFGVPFGRYRYLRFRIATLFNVPIPIIIAWGTYLYTSYLASLALTRDKWRRLVLASLLMVLLDLAIDPAMVSAGFWEWLDTGPWFGIPMSNFVGWFTVSFVATLLYTQIAKSNPEGSPALYLPYLATYPQLFYFANGEALLAVSISFTIAILIFGLVLQRYITKKLPVATRREQYTHS
jgi:putative membrane protein